MLKLLISVDCVITGGQDEKFASKGVCGFLSLERVADFCFLIQSLPIRMRVYHSNERCRISAILRHRGFKAFFGPPFCSLTEGKEEKDGSMGKMGRACFAAALISIGI